MTICPRTVGVTIYSNAFMTGIVSNISLLSGDFIRLVPFSFQSSAEQIESCFSPIVSL